MVHWSKNFHKSGSLVQQLNSCWYINHDQRNLVLYCLLFIFKFYAHICLHFCFLVPQKAALDRLVERLEKTYFATFGYTFPLTGKVVQ